ncbi:MAG: lytic transglycosylase domain-containing protein [Leptospiraceae bacterium]|nr:lytic transglycosylase domain-containing protein [Leptospiraceae bacterium]MCK6380212.1 lytic transglycosylase domain-containing protein [Leptospiraceae bacterium]NUM41322.1 lytic transglycosylase domain-containing protein [Leptospiraceae bacterium]
MKKRLKFSGSILILFAGAFQLHPILTTTSSLKENELKGYIASKNTRIIKEEESELAKTILQESKKLEIPAHLKIDGKPINKAAFLTALIQTESVFKRKAVSYKNAKGYMQLMPTTYKWIKNKSGKKHDENAIFLAKENIPSGVEYLNLLMNEFQDLRLVCLAYNAGPGAVKRGILIESYYRKIVTIYREIQNQENGKMEEKSLALNTEGNAYQATLFRLSR